MSWWTEQQMLDCILPDGRVRYPSPLADLVLRNENYFNRYYPLPHPCALDVPREHIDEILAAQRADHKEYLKEKEKYDNEF